MKEEEYGKLPADQKKCVDRALRAIPKTLDEITKVITAAPVASVNGDVKIETTVSFGGGFTHNECKKINEWWG